MDVERFEETLAQIKREMLSFIKFYTNGVLTTLRKLLLEFDTSHTTRKGEGSIKPSNQNKNRNTPSSVEKGVVEGKKALTMVTMASTLKGKLLWLSKLIEKFNAQGTPKMFG